MHFCIPEIQLFAIPFAAPKANNGATHNAVQSIWSETMQTENKVALVLGARGGIGSEVTRSLLRRGWLVRALVRSKSYATELKHPRLECVSGDAMRRQDVIDAAYGASVIVHAVNPAKYHNWSGLALPMLDNTIAAAALFRATVLFPGTIYNYGDSSALLDESAPQIPNSRKGAIRVEMEERLRDASWDRIRAVIVRAGDFFGASANSSWLSQGVIQHGQPIRFAFSPGTPDLMHSWAYLPDVAETMVRLLEQRRSLPAFDTYHFKGHWLRNGDLMDAVCRLAGISNRRVLPFPWAAIRAGAPFVELFEEMREMRYLWQTPIELDNAKLVARIGSEPHTSIREALRNTLVGIGCIRDKLVAPTQVDLTR
jgi:nucleoside-diphosphate-sugar epimerase